MVRRNCWQLSAHLDDRLFARNWRLIIGFEYSKFASKIHGDLARARDWCRIFYKSR
jgi:hypothetical protein